MSSDNTSAPSATGFSQANDATCTSGEPRPLKTGSGNIMPTFSHDSTIDYDGTSDERLTLDKCRCTKLCCCQVDGCSEDTAKSCSGKTKPCASKAACDEPDKLGKTACDESDKGVLGKASESTSRAGNKVSQTASKFMDKVTGSNKSDPKPKDITKPKDVDHKDAPQEGLVGDLQRKVTAGHEAGPGEHPFPTSSIPPPPQTDGACEEEHQDQTDGTSCGPNGCDGSAEGGSGGCDEIKDPQSHSSRGQDQTDGTSCGPNGCDGSPEEDESEVHQSQTDGSCCGPNGCDGSPEEDEAEVQHSQTDGTSCGPNGCDGPTEEDDSESQHPKTSDAGDCGPSACDASDKDTKHCNTAPAVSHAQTDGTGCCDGATEEPAARQDPCRQVAEGITNSAVQQSQTDGSGCGPIVGGDGSTEDDEQQKCCGEAQTDGSGSCGPNGCDGAIEDTTPADDTEQQRHHAQRDSPRDDARVEEVPDCTTIQ